MAKYSIILPVRNGGHLVKKCVAGILNQAYTDFNFIILDNCSTDGCLEWFYSLHDKRIEIIPAERPLTIEENWGRVTALKKNEYMTLIGHDDLLNPDFLQMIDTLISQNPAASLYHTHFNFIDATGKVIRACKPMKAAYTGSEYLQALITSSIDSMGTGYVMRSKDYDALGGIPTKYPNLLFADFELWTNLAARNFIAIAPGTCFSFRVHPGTTQTSANQLLHRALVVFVDYLAELKSVDREMATVIDQYGSSFLLHYCTAYAHRLLRVPIQNRDGVTVDDWINQTKKMANNLGVAADYLPEKKSSLQLAKRIDQSSFMRAVFLLFKKIYSKPVL